MNRRWPCLLIGIAWALTIPAARAWAQESDVAEQPAPLEASFGLQSRIAGTILIHEGVPGPGFSPGEERSWSLETRQEVELTLKIADVVQVVQRAAVTTSDRECEGLFESTTRPGILESTLALTPLPGARIAVGIVRPSFGDSLFFNATDWLSRFALDPIQPGAGSFLGMDARASIGEWSFSLTILPAFADTGLGLFNEEPDTHIAAFKASWLIGSACVGGTIFGESSPDFARLFAGGGIEVQAPLGEHASIDAQALVSNGSRASTLTETLGVLTLAERDASEAEIFADASAELECTLGSFLLARISYRYAGRGLAAESIRRLRTEGYLPARTAGLAALMPRYSSALKWPPSLLDHTLACSLALPRVSETLGASLTAFASPLDASAWARFVITWGPTENVNVELSAESGLGAEGSLFRLFRQEAAFALSCEVSI